MYSTTTPSRQQVPHGSGGNSGGKSSGRRIRSALEILAESQTPRGTLAPQSKSVSPAGYQASRTTPGFTQTSTRTNSRVATLGNGEAAPRDEFHSQYRPEQQQQQHHVDAAAPAPVPVRRAVGDEQPPSTLVFLSPQGPRDQRPTRRSSSGRKQRHPADETMESHGEPQQQPHFEAAPHHHEPRSERARSEPQQQQAPPVEALLEAQDAQRDAEEEAFLETMAAEVDELNAQNAVLTEANQKLEEEKGRVVAHHEVLMRTVNDLNEDLIVLREQSSKMKTQLEDTEAARKRDQKEFEAELRMEKAQTAHAAEFEREEAAASARVKEEDLQRKLFRAEETITEREASIETLEQKLSTELSRAQTMEGQLDEFDRLAKVLNGDLADRDAEISRIQKKAAMLERKLAAAQAAHSEDASALQERIVSLESGTKVQSDDLRKKLHKVTQLERQIEQRDGTIRNERTENEKHTEKFAQLSSSIETLARTVEHVGHTEDATKGAKGSSAAGRKPQSLIVSGTNPLQLVMSITSRVKDIVKEHREAKTALQVSVTEYRGLESRAEDAIQLAKTASEETKVMETRAKHAEERAESLHSELVVLQKAELKQAEELQEHKVAAEAAAAAERRSTDSQQQMRFALDEAKVATEAAERRVEVLEKSLADAETSLAARTAEAQRLTALAQKEETAAAAEAQSTANIREELERLRCSHREALDAKERLRSTLRTANDDRSKLQARLEEANQELSVQVSRCKTLEATAAQLRRTVGKVRDQPVTPKVLEPDADAAALSVQVKRLTKENELLVKENSQLSVKLRAKERAAAAVANAPSNASSRQLLQQAKEEAVKSRLADERGWLENVLASNAVHLSPSRQRADSEENDAAETSEISRQRKALVSYLTHIRKEGNENQVARSALEKTVNSQADTIGFLEAELSVARAADPTPRRPTVGAKAGDDWQLAASAASRALSQPSPQPIRVMRSGGSSSTKKKFSPAKSTEPRYNESVVAMSPSPRYTMGAPSTSPQSTIPRRMQSYGSSMGSTSRSPDAPLDFGAAVKVLRPSPAATPSVSGSAVKRPSTVDAPAPLRRL